MDQITDAVSNGNLCEKCSSLNFDKLFIHGGVFTRINLDYVMLIVQRKNCNFCQLVTRALRLSWRELPLRWTLKYGLDDKRGWSTCRLTGEWGVVVDNAYDHDCCVVKLDVTDSTERRFLPDNYDPEIRVLKADRHRLGFARMINEVIDSELVRSWLEQCRLSHPDANSRLSTLKHMRVIDVENMRIIEAPTNCRYVSLSYVWGTDAVCLEARVANYLALEVEGSLSMDALPFTIQDSILLLKNLEEKYLWVDRLCIIQDGPHKREQIAHMVDIYRDAAFTIVAAGVGGASAHLAGVTPGSRAPSTQFTTTVKGFDLVLSTPPLHYVLDYSKWKTRAWTYQEWQFSSRALIFTPEEVFFMCSCGTRCESLVSQHESTPSELRATKVLGNLGGLADEPKVEIPRHRITSSNLRMNNAIDWLHSIQEYSEREMTYESDVLLAMWSAMEEFRLCTGVGLLAGLHETDIHIGLMWQPKVSLRRRGAKTTDGRLFPTWSWCGWVGQVQYELGELTPMILTRLKHNWFFVGYNDTLQFLDSGIPRDSNDKDDKNAEDRQNEPKPEDDMSKLESELGIRLSLESHRGTTESVGDRFHQDEVQYNKISNWIAISQFEALAGRKPKSKAEVAQARQLIAYEDLDGALAEEHYLYLSGHHSGEQTPVTMIRKIQEMCSQNISTLKSRLAPLETPADAAPQHLNSQIAETGFLVFKAPCAYFTVHTSLAHEFTDKRPIYPFGIYNARHTRIGEVVLNSNDQLPPSRAEFVVVCKQHPHPRLALMPERAGERVSSEAWSIMRDVKYGVLMIERWNGTAYRIGQGTISVPKWDEEVSVERLIVLG